MYLEDEDSLNFLYKMDKEPEGYSRNDHLLNIPIEDAIHLPSGKRFGNKNISDLSNVHTAAPTDGQVLAWDNGNSRWAPSNVGSGDITRVNITAGTGLTGTQDTTAGDHTQTLNRTYVYDGSANIENEVADLNISTQSSSLPNIIEDEIFFSFGIKPDSTVNNYKSIEQKLCFDTKDSSGVLISDVPIYFELYGNDDANYWGSLSSTLQYTKSENDESNEETTGGDDLEGADTGGGENQDTNCVSNSIGEACICYEVLDVNEDLIQNGSVKKLN